MPRYTIDQFDGSTFQVVDLYENREICVCADYDDREDARERAENIVAKLNKDTEASLAKGLWPSIISLVKGILRIYKED